MKKNNIRVYFILADENLFHPYFLKSVITDLIAKKYKIVGITLAKDTYKKGFHYAVYQQISLWGFGPFAFIAVNSIFRTLAYKFGFMKTKTIQGLSYLFNIPLYETLNVNEEEHIKYLKKKKIDIIISSNGHIFKSELLKLPKIACINRHSALLPSYGGVLPIFWAMKNREKILGTSAHYMVEKIDQGDILAFESFSNEKGSSLFYNYMLAFDASISVIISAIENALKKKIVKKFKKNKNEYYSFPNKQKIKEFKRKDKTMSFKDIFKYYSIYN
jgi:methionyl-tRNA formyltransferase